MSINFALLFPSWVAIGILFVAVAAELAQPKKTAAARQGEPAYTSGVALIGALLLFLAVIPFMGKMESSFGGMFILDPLASFFKAFFALIALVLIPMSREFFARSAGDSRQKPVTVAFASGEFYLILWCSLIGLFFLVSANDLLLVFVTLEIFTLSLYILTAYLKHELVSIEAGIKYLVLGSLASAFLIYGISLIYAAAGSTSLPDVRAAYAASPYNQMLLLWILLSLAGLGFKVASVPFQLWAPDVYEGAPTPVAAYLSVGSKAAGFAILLRLLFTVFLPFESDRILLFSVLAAMTLLYGNLGALLQTNIKRLMAYSSIGHAGYLLVGIAAGGEMGTSAMLFYLIAYAVSNLAAFFVITLVGGQAGTDQLEGYRGLGKRAPFLAGALFIALLSLAGVPPLAGFFGKFLILLAAVKSGLGGLALLGALAVAVSLYYSLSVVRVMYFEDSGGEEKFSVSISSELILACLMAGILVAGIWQQPFLGLAALAARSLF